MQIRIIATPISRTELQAIANEGFGNMVKAVVDIDQRIMAVGGELHADEEARLLTDGSRQADLWGINLYPELTGVDFIEFDSMINLRPSQPNLTRAVDDPATQAAIRTIVGELIR